MDKDNQTQYEIVSLGYACMTRAFLTQENLISTKADGRKSMVFDLMPNPTSVITQCIKDNFEGYFDNFSLDYYNRLNQVYWHNKKYDVYYIHDRDCRNNFEVFKNRYEQRIENFKEALNNPKFTYFIHVPKDFDKDNLAEDLDDLYKALKKTRGEKPYRLIVWNIEDNINGKINDAITVINQIHPQKDTTGWFEPEFWTEENKIWKAQLIENTKKEIQKDGFEVELFDNEKAEKHFLDCIFKNTKIISFAQNIFKVENDHDINVKLLTLFGKKFVLKKLHFFDYSDIVIKLDGRMGNQMFQWAFGRAIETKNNANPVFDDSRETLKLDCFKLSENIKIIRKPIWNKILRKIIIFRNLRNKLTELKINIPHYKEETACLFQPDLLDVNPPAYISGYFQTEKYFENIKEQLQKDFQLIKPLNNANKKMLEKIKKTNSVSVHFRRGDFLKSRVAVNFGNLGEQYYQEAIKYIAEHTSEPITLFIFSDDINWIRENVKFEYDTVYVDVNSGKQGFFDLELMKNCKHNVIANSSFSWWGGWLNENPDKIVVMPSPVRPHKPDYDRIPNSWIKVNPYFN